MEEIWKDIKGYEGVYQVSNLGRVKSLPRLHKFAHGYYMTKEKILSPRICGKQREYLAVALQIDGKTKQYKVHRLVAIAFLPNPYGYNEINHKDENKGNNKMDNLEWCTRSYNVNYGSRIEKQRKALIKPVVAYSKAYEFVKEFDSIVDASKFAKVDATNISRACRKEGRISGGYLWKYKNIEK
jgi:hypothetical protein